MQGKATSEDAYLQETMHFSNHTLAWTVSTEIYCTLKLDVPLKSKKQGEGKSGYGCASTIGRCLN